jgi:hypothetical protein
MGQTPANSSSGWVSGSWGCTFEAGMAFIGAGAGVDVRLVRRRAARVGGAPRVCSGAPECVEHVGVCFCLCSSTRRDHNRANLTKGLVQISSWHLGLASLCKFQWKICPRSQDMWAPSQVCRHWSPVTKSMSNHVKQPQFEFKFFRGVPWVILGTFCYLVQVGLAPAPR